MSAETVTDRYLREKYALQMRTAYRGRKVDSEGWDHDEWRISLASTRHDRRWGFPFKMGVGHDGHRPSLTAVVSSLVLDSQSLLNCPWFEQWAEDHGYDPDSRRAERIYLQVREQDAKLCNFLGVDDYNELLTDEDWDY